MEQNYFEKVHRNEIMSNSEVQTTLVFDISKTSQKRNAKTTTIHLEFPSVFYQNYIKKHVETTSIEITSKKVENIKVRSKNFVHQNYAKKKVYRNDVVFRSSKLSPKNYVETMQIFHQSKLRRIKHIKTTWSFSSAKLRRAKLIETTLIFRP